MIKKICIVLIGLLIIYISLIAIILNTVNTNDNPMYEESEKQKITVWGWDDDVINAFKEYIKDRNDVEIEFIYVSHSSFVDRLKTAMVTSTDLPDICILNDDYIKNLINVDMWVKLEEEPYNLNKNEIIETSLPMVTNRDGDVVAIPHELGISGVSYRKSLMKKVIGSDDKTDVREAFRQWNDVIEKGKEMKNSFNRDFYMFASASDVGSILINQTNDLYVKDNKLVDPKKYLEYFKILTDLRDSKLIGKSQQWSPDWYDSFKEESCLFYPWSMWMPRYGVFGIDGKNDWGIATAPGGSYNTGTTAWAILKSSENKELAWEFMKYFLLSYDGAEYNKIKGKGVFINYKPAYEVDGYIDLYHENFGTENIGKACFDDLIIDSYQRQFSEYDIEVNEAFFKTIEGIIRDENLTAEKAYYYFISLLKESLPQIKIY